MTPSAPSYRNHLTGGLYKITYKAPIGNQKNGIPVNPGSDLVNLEKIAGSGPTFIVTSEYDFNRNFTKSAAITETPTKAPTTTKASK